MLILYCYKEDAETKKNLEYFLRHGVVDDPSIQYRFLINNNTVTSVFPEYSNIKVIRRTENEYDLLSYKWYLSKHNESADMVIFLNSSCKGPIEKEGYKWINHFRSKLTTADIVGPVFTFFAKGTPQQPPFIHTFMFGANKRGFESIVSTFETYNKILGNVYDLERDITRNAIKAGLKIQSFLSRFEHVDLSNPENWDPTKWGIHPVNVEFETPGNYFGGDIDPKEVVFFKNIRRPHAVRPVHSSGISPSIKKYLDSLV